MTIDARTPTNLLSIARHDVDSYTIAERDGLWVIEEARKGRSSEDIHRELNTRVGYYASAREVAAIVRLVAPPPPADAEVDPLTELCAKCGFTYYNHESNTGVPYPCWTPSGRFSPDKRTNQPRNGCLTPKDARTLLNAADYYNLEIETMFGDMTTALAGLRRLAGQPSTKKEEA